MVRLRRPNVVFLTVMMILNSGGSVGAEEGVKRFLEDMDKLNEWVKT